MKLSDLHIMELAGQLRLSIPKEIAEYVKEYGEIVVPILAADLPLVFFHLKSWPSVLTDIIMAVRKAGKMPLGPHVD